MSLNSLPRWTGQRREVTASIIRTITEAGEGGYLLTLSCGSTKAVSVEWMRYLQPVVGGYYIHDEIHGEGYLSNTAFLQHYEKQPPRWFDTQTKRFACKPVDVVAAIYSNADEDNPFLEIGLVEANFNINVRKSDVQSRPPRKGDKVVTFALPCSEEYLFITKEEFKDRFVLEYRVDAK